MAVFYNRIQWRCFRMGSNGGVFFPTRYWSFRLNKCREFLGYSRTATYRGIHQMFMCGRKSNTKYETWTFIRVKPIPGLWPRNARGWALPHPPPSFPSLADMLGLLLQNQLIDRQISRRYFLLGFPVVYSRLPTSRNAVVSRLISRGQLIKCSSLRILVICHLNLTIIFICKD